MPKIELINVVKRWGDFYAVDNLNLVIDDRSFITLLGPSGCGKTTTLRMIAGLETPTSGKILINGVPVFDSELGINIPANKRHVGFLFQNYALWPHMTIKKNIVFGLQNLKDEMPLVSTDYYVNKKKIEILSNHEVLKKLIDSFVNKDGNVVENNALIGIIDNYKVSMYTAKDLYKISNLSRKDPSIIDQKIAEFNSNMKNIADKYEQKGFSLNEKGDVLGLPDICNEYVSCKIIVNVLRDPIKLIKLIAEAQDDKENVVEFVSAKLKISKETAKKLINFKIQELKEEDLKEKVTEYIDIENRNIFDIKKQANIDGYQIDEKGNKIPNIDFEDKEWDHKLVHIIKNRKLDNEEIDLRLRHVSRVVKIAEFMDRYPNELSGGQQQRVAIARTLAPGPKVLFMDEPLSNLDAKLRLEMRGELKRLHLDTNSTFIYVTHDQLEAMTLATKICLIDNGILQQYDAPLDVYKKPANLFVADFVGNPAVNFVETNAIQKEGSNEISIKLFDSINAAFVPNEKINLEKLRLLRDKDIKESKEAYEIKKNSKGFVEKGNKDKVFNFHVQMISGNTDSKDEKNISSNEYVIGIRPEFIKISDDGNVEGEIYNALPSGMETTVKIRIGEYVLTGVIFGGVDYKIGSKCHLSFIGKEISLFDRISGKRICDGAIKIK